MQCFTARQTLGWNSHSGLCPIKMSHLTQQDEKGQAGRLNSLTGRSWKSRGLLLFLPSQSFWLPFQITSLSHPPLWRSADKRVEGRIGRGLEKAHRKAYSMCQALRYTLDMCFLVYFLKQSKEVVNE